MVGGTNQKAKRPKWTQRWGLSSPAMLILSPLKLVEPAWESTYLHWISGKKGENPGARGVCIHYFLRTKSKKTGSKRIIGRKEKSEGNIKGVGRFCGGFGLFRIFLQWFTCELLSFFCFAPLNYCDFSGSQCKVLCKYFNVLCRLYNWLLIEPVVVD